MSQPGPELTRIPSTPPPKYEGDTARWASLLNKYLGEQLLLLQSLTGGALRWQNLRSQFLSAQQIAAASIPTPPTPVTISHNLGTIPSVYVVMPQSNPLTVGGGWALFATAADRLAWTASSIQLTYDDATTAAPNTNPAIDYDLWILA